MLPRANSAQSMNSRGWMLYIELKLACRAGGTDYEVHAIRMAKYSSVGYR